jgi:hypothetical protein
MTWYNLKEDMDIRRKTKQDTRITLDFSKSAVFCAQSFDELKETIGYLGFNPDHWI